MGRRQSGSITGNQTQTSSPYSSHDAATSDSIMSSGGTGKCGLSRSSSVRRGNELDGVGAEDGEVADVFAPTGGVPGVVRVRLRPVAELVAADAQPGSGGHVEIGPEKHPPIDESQLAEQFPDSEENPAGVIPGHHDGSPARVDHDLEALGARGRGNLGELHGDPGGAKISNEVRRRSWADSLPASGRQF